MTCRPSIGAFALLREHPLLTRRRWVDDTLWMPAFRLAIEVRSNNVYTSSRFHLILDPVMLFPGQRGTRIGQGFVSGSFDGVAPHRPTTRTARTKLRRTDHVLLKLNFVPSRRSAEMDLALVKGEIEVAERAFS